MDNKINIRFDVKGWSKYGFVDPPLLRRGVIEVEIEYPVNTLIDDGTKPINDKHGIVIQMYATGMMDANYNVPIYAFD